MTTSTLILKTWLTSNAPILDGRTPHDIADLAIACGLDRLAVCQWLTHETFVNQAVA